MSDCGMRNGRLELALGAVADVVGQAAALPDHSDDDRRESPEAWCTSPAGEVQVTVAAGLVRSIRLEEFWLQGAAADEVAGLVTRVTNLALEQWAQQRLEWARQWQPGLQELDVAIAGARRQLQEAWEATLREVAT